MMEVSVPDAVGELFSLRGRSAIVTGASRGIGWALAGGLARAGAQVLALARSQSPESPLPTRCVYRPCDVAKDNEFARCLEAFVAETGSLDVLVNAAGISLDGESTDAFDRTLDVNLRGPYLCARAAAAVMRKEGHGSIINVTSLGAFRGFPGNPGYVAAKGGLNQLTRALACDYGPHGIRVNNLVPGYIATAMTAVSHADHDASERRRAHTMLGRWGEVSDLVGAAIFLASDASAYVTGQDIVVDGGWLAKGLA